MISAECINSAVGIDGKFLRRRAHKFFFKAMRFEASAFDFDQKLACRRRFEQLARAHTTGVLIPAEQAEALLGIADQAGLAVLVEVRISPDELRFGIGREIERCTAIARALHGSSNLLGMLIDCPIEIDELRAAGLANFRKPLARLMRELRRSLPDRCVALAHRPATIALASPEESLIYAKMPALAPDELRQFVIRLHNLAECRPVVLEFGAGLGAQDELVACAFGLGAAGVVAPAMPLVAANTAAVRMLSAGELLPFVTLNGSCPPKLATAPMVSVVICAYNAERTMRPCLESLRRMNYPNYEVVIVDDGSRDATAEIAADFPEFRLIRQPNKGLSVARNVGLHAALGAIVAYTDSDCVVDPDWLNLMTRAMSDCGFDGCGGPNYAPHEAGRVEACVAASPGAPCHVLIDDEQAEHLAGCNMVFRKSALAQIGGFDPQFTAAGDDVDICWRMLDAGFSLGYCPSAFVWHFRRNTVKAYYGQQRGYGKAEALLYVKYPERFNVLGQIRWRGVIPGLARTIPGGNRRVCWTRSADAMQRVADPPLKLASVLPLTAEWQSGAGVLLALSWVMGVTLIPALVLLTLGPLWAGYYAWQAPLEAEHRGVWSRLLIAWLAYSGPISRTIARYRMRRQARTPGALEPPRQRPAFDLRRRALRLSYWNENWTTRDRLLTAITELLARAGTAATPDLGWGDADLKFEPGALSRVEIKTADEEHSGNRVKNLVAIRARLTAPTRVGLMLGILIAAGALAAGFTTAAIAAGMLSAALSAATASEIFKASHRCYRVVEQAANELGLTPLGAPTLARSRPGPVIEAVAPRFDQIAG